MGMSHADFWVKHIPSRENSKHKGAETGAGTEKNNEDHTG